MNRIFKITGIVLAFFLFSSKTCVNQSQETAAREKVVIQKSIDSLKREFETARLSDNSFFAFEEKAKQKLRDMADYLEIIYNSDIDIAFRKQANLMLTDLFPDMDPGLTIQFTGKGKYVILPLIYLGEEEFNDQFDSIRISIDSINQTIPFRRDDPQMFSGQLEGTFQFCGYFNGDSAVLGPSTNTVDIFLTKKNKSFGQDSLNIWGVYLGSIQVKKRLQK